MILKNKLILSVIKDVVSKWDKQKMSKIRNY